MFGVLPFLALQTTDSENYLGIFLQGQKVGYASYVTKQTQFDGKPAQLANSVTQVRIGLIGSQVEMRVESDTISVSGKTVRMTTKISSAGRTQEVVAHFKGKTIQAEVNNNGAKSSKTLTIPENATVVDDPLTEFFSNSNSAKDRDFYVFDATTVTLIKNTLRLKGDAEIDVNGKKRSSKEIEIEDPRLTTTVFTDSNGEILKVSTSIGLEMFALSKEEALKESTEEVRNPDLADLTSIVPNPRIENPAGLKRLKIRLKVDKLNNLPNDTYQQVKKVNGVWEIDINPAQLKNAKSVSIAAAGKQRKEWTRPGLHIPSDSTEFRNLGKKIIGNRKDVRSASLAIRKWVNENMIPNAGIGVLRDASEILRKREGVCRDYAILTATLTRAVGIPTRLASGLVNFDGNFYYHAWVEVYTGFDWIPMDSIPPTDHFSATHVKLSQGSVEDAFTFTVLSKARMDVLLAK